MISDDRMVQLIDPLNINCLVADAHAIFETPPGEIFGRFVTAPAQAFALIIDHFGFTIINICVVGTGEYFGHCIGRINLIAGIHKQHIIASGQRKPLFIAS